MYLSFAPPTPDKTEHEPSLTCQTPKLSVKLEKFHILFGYENWVGLTQGEAIRAFTGRNYKLE
jgi:hypothetical protein